MLEFIYICYVAFASKPLHSPEVHSIYKSENLGHIIFNSHVHYCVQLFVLLIGKPYNGRLFTHMSAAAGITEGYLDISQETQPDCPVVS